MPSILKARPTGTFGVEVVGESHYQENLEAICGPRTENSVDLTVQATLSPEGDNPHDPQAVRVEIHGKLVGYLSREMAPHLAPPDRARRMFNPTEGKRRL
jgi:hypothetical protein